MKENQAKEVIKALGEIASKFETYIVNTCPAGFARTKAIERLYECLLWSQAAIMGDENDT